MKWNYVYLSIILVITLGFTVYVARQSQTLLQRAQSLETVVTMRNIKLEPVTVTIPVGTTVKWTNNDTIIHTSTFHTPGTPDSWDSGNIQIGGQYTRTFTKAGSYPYHCTIHLQMEGTIVVTDGAVSPDNPTPTHPPHPTVHATPAPTIPVLPTQPEGPTPTFGSISVPTSPPMPTFTLVPTQPPVNQPPPAQTPPVSSPLASKGLISLLIQFLISIIKILFN